MYTLSHLFHFHIFLLSLLFMVPTSDTYPTYDDKTDFYIVMVIAMTFSIINLLGSLYLFYRTFLQWRYDRSDDGSIQLTLRLPFYIAIIDFLFSSTTLINLSYSASNQSKLPNGGAITWPSPYCEVIGFFTISFVLSNMLLVGAISVTTWLRVVKEYYFDWGKYDYKIWTPIVLISLIITFFSIYEDFHFDSQEYLCGISTRATITCSIIIILTFFTIVVCYVLVLRTIYNINRNDSNSDNSTSHFTISVPLDEMGRRSLKKVLTYILVFIFQYIPLLTFTICKFFKVQHVIIYAFSLSAVSIGGIGNLIQYIYNEGLIFRSLNNDTSSNK